MNNKIKIVIADDSVDIKAYFKMILEKESDMQVIGTASNGMEAVRVVSETHPDIVLMDVQMDSEIDGIEAIELIKEKQEQAKIIVLTIHEEDDILFRAYSAGAIDYIVKTCSIVEIINSIRDVFGNNLQLRPEIAQRILGEFSRMKKEQDAMILTLNLVARLTNAEFEIVKAIYKGENYKSIARSRYVQEVTIRTQVNKILKKFGKASMKEVVKVLAGLRIFDIYDK